MNTPGAGFSFGSVFCIISNHPAKAAQYEYGAGSGGRTRTVSLPKDFESSSSANSNIPAQTPDPPENTVIVPQNDGFVNSFFHIQRSAANSTDRTPPRCHRRTPAAS